MRELIRGLKGTHTVLVSSHILPEISQTCDRLLVINGGQLVAQGTEEELARTLGSRRHRGGGARRAGEGAGGAGGRRAG